MTLLAKRYASALFALATEQEKAAQEQTGQKVTDAVAADLSALHAALTSPAARAVIMSPDVTATERAALLDKLCSGRVGLLRNLVGVLQQRRRLDVLFDLQPAYQALVMAARGEVEGIAETAHALAADELAALTALAGRLSGKKVHLTTVLRPELIGGVRLRIGNVLYDGSLRAALDQLQVKLTQAAV